MRKLTQAEINDLEGRGCTATDWHQILVTDGFRPEQCYHAHFVGRCTIGDLSGRQESGLGYQLPNGIRHARIQDCHIGDGVCIEGVRGAIARYDIGPGTLIHNVDTIAIQGDSTTFGIGTTISVMNEMGGIEVPLSAGLTAQIAYILTLLPDYHGARRALLKLLQAEASDVRSKRGTIGNHCRILHSGTITDTYIGSGSIIEGASRLHDAYLDGTETYPVQIGQNVIGTHFVAASGAMVLGGTMIERCFIGQGCRLDHAYAAHDSLLFANCALENGEASAIFAGPFTASHHKSSLLIAGHFSFLNAGSGSNQSNHLYKLGPMHQGVVERGSKTSSDSYILWPARVGAFTLVMGRHVHNTDTSDFPFSYLFEHKDASYLVPGRNLLSVGTMRDAKKWPERDKRPPEDKRDCINYNLLSPFTIGKMERAYHLLHQIEQEGKKEGDTYCHNNFYIRERALKRGQEIYRWGIEKFIGNSLITRIYDCFGKAAVPSPEALSEALRPDGLNSEGAWIDMGSMIAPLQQIKALMQHLSEQRYSNTTELTAAIRALHHDYYHLEWDWSYHLLCRWYSIDPEASLTPAQVKEIVDRWIEAVLAIDRALYADARKEYDIIQRVNFGIREEADQDSEALHANEVDEAFAQNSIVHLVKNHIERKSNLRKKVLKQISKLLE